MNRIFNAITGPSGAGKSAFCRQQPDWEHRLYNLDDWARIQGEIDNPTVRESAWESLLERLLSDMDEGLSPIALDHIFESSAIDEVVRPAKAHGYRIRSWVICPESPQICVRRVQKRKSEGGHGRSAGTVRELYDSALHVASELSVLSHETILIDSSGKGFEVVGCVRDFRATIKIPPAPRWVSKSFLGETVPRISRR